MPTTLRRTNTTSRPWSVYALALMIVSGTVVGMIASDGPAAVDVLGASFNLWFAFALWAGKGWAFALMFMLVTLCLAVGVAAAIIAVALLEQDLPASAILGAVTAVALIALLMRPETKRFAGMERGPQ